LKSSLLATGGVVTNVDPPTVSGVMAVTVHVADAELYPAGGEPQFKIVAHFPSEPDVELPDPVYTLSKPS
jgi:hypothetical protein